MLRAVRIVGVVVGVVVTVVAATLVIGAGPAAAHICTPVAEIPLGRPVTLRVGVTVENAVIPDVEVVMPSALHIGRVDREPGWTAKREGASVWYRGGPFTPYSCGAFTFRVTATARGVFVVGVTQRRADGSVFARSQSTGPPNPVFQQVVYAGIRAPRPGSAGPSGVTIAGAALLVAGVLLLGWTWWRRRGVTESEDDDDDDAAQRLEEFRKRLRDQ